jgi:putative transcriptional regulator
MGASPPRAALMLATLLLLTNGFPLLSRRPLTCRGTSVARSRGLDSGRHRNAPRLCSTDSPGPPAASEDWRDVRARLVAMEQLERQGTSQSTNGSGVRADLDGSPPPQPAERLGGAQVYETPLIEQGSVILGGTQQEFGFALRQQYFHKSVMLLLQHDPTFTRGIMLNRPSAMEMDGWRVWFGGDVSEGGLFHGGSPDGPSDAGRREVVCLHSLESAAAARLSMPIIRGVAHTTLEGAKALIEQGDSCPRAAAATARAAPASAAATRVAAPAAHTRHPRRSPRPRGASHAEAVAARIAAASAVDDKLPLHAQPPLSKLNSSSPHTHPSTPCPRQFAH